MNRSRGCCASVGATNQWSMGSSVGSSSVGSDPVSGSINQWAGSPQGLVPGTPKDTYVHINEFGLSRCGLSLSLTRPGRFAVTRILGTAASAWFQLPVHNAASPWLHGVRKGRSPASSLLWGAATLAIFSPRFVSFAWRYLGAPAFRPRSAADAGPTDHPGVCCTGCSRSGLLQGNGQDLPRSRKTRAIIRHVPPTPV